MDLRALRYFVAIAEMGSFSSASRLLHVAQPALSRQIRNLERELGISLCERTARGLLLSESGTQLLGDGRQILDAVDQATARVRRGASEVKAHVALGITPSVSMVLTAPLLTNVQKRLPSISLSAVESMVGNGSEWLDWVRDKHLDFALMYDVERPSVLRSETLLIEELHLVGKPTRRPTGRQVAFESLGQYPLVLPSRIHPLRQIVDRAAQRTGTKLHIAEESNSILEVKTMVRRGKVYSILSPCAVWEERQHKELFASRIVKPSLPRRLNILSLPGALRSPAVRSVDSEIRATIRQLVDDAHWDASLV
jgi:LysR family nitrogen assimilation transcriptional regulator